MATLNWLAMTSQMWTKGNFAALDQVTTGEARTVYLTEKRQAAGDPGPSGRTPFKLSGMAITASANGICCPMPDGMSETAALVMAVNMPEPVKMPVKAPAASRMPAISKAALACASTRARCCAALG